MCGIAGYIGEEEAAPLLLNGLRKMEYRGYDSAGISTIQEGSIVIKKSAGRIAEIHSRMNLLDLKGHIGVAHTRWATHGGVTEWNAHPHTSCRREVAIVHNGIIENHQALREELAREGHVFSSETDSEVIAHLLERSHKMYGDVKTAALDVVAMLKGAFAFLAIFSSNPKVMVGVRKDAPLVIGVGGRGCFIASDILAFIEHTDKVIFLENRELALVYGRSVDLYTFEGVPVKREITQVAWEAKDISKEEFAHFTIKEIKEQPQTIPAALFQDQGKLRKFCEAIKSATTLHITGCGTSYHAGLILSYLLTKLAKIRSGIALSSEFGQEAELIRKGSLVIAFSQSGETADLLSAVADAEKRGGEVYSIVNVMGSSLARENPMSLYINCGPEIGVAATKSFTGQLALSDLLAFTVTGDGERLSRLRGIGLDVEEALKSEDVVIRVAEKYKDCNDFYFVGRSLNYPIALEGALKLKELAYNHAEGMAGGELKHGTLALIEDGTPVVVLNPEDDTYSEMLSNAFEMKARGARIIGVSNRTHPVYDEFLKIPTVDSLLYPIVEVVPLQMLAYYMAVARQKNPDYPRNLAKSVTVK